MALIENISLSEHDDDSERLAQELERTAEEQGWPTRVLFGLQVASDEWISNVIKYSYVASTCWKIHVSVVSDEHFARIIVRDTGTAFDPATAPIPADLSDTLRGAREGGMGLMMMHHLLDSISYTTKGGENIVTLSMELKS